MTTKLRYLVVLALALTGLAVSAAPSVAHPQYGYGYGYPTPRGRGEVVIIQPPVRSYQRRIHATAIIGGQAFRSISASDPGLRGAAMRRSFAPDVHADFT